MERETPQGMFGIPHAMALKEAERAKADARARSPEQVRVVDKDELNLGELNPLTHSPELARKESVRALSQITREKIAKYGGEEPVSLDATLVISRNPNIAPQLRYIARFEIDQISEEQIQMLEHLVADRYPVAVKTRKTKDGKDIELEDYPPVNPTEAGQARNRGWYIGPSQTNLDSLHPGLFLFKDTGETTTSNFVDSTPQKTKYIVEIREAGMYQTDLVEFITQTASILGKGELVNRGDLLYEIYYDLVRLGLKKSHSDAAFGLDEPIERIKRGLLIPLASRKLSKGLGEEPESALLIGVPGTGKTLVAQALLQQETGVFILPIDPLELSKELHTDKDKQRLLPRIAEVAHMTGRDVVLHIDDIENMVGSDQATHSTLLNLMAGINEQGFFTIASTNEPEKIDPALLQPQRFGILIHFGLQQAAARHEILKRHASLVSDRLNIPLFTSEEEREAILTVLTKYTADFTPRYLAEIANVAKSHLLVRIATERGTGIGLTEEDLLAGEFRFTPEDWLKAYEEVSRSYDINAIRRHNERLAAFVRKYGREFGFGGNGHTNGKIAEELYSLLSPTKS